jgi:hypothetical protein
VTDRDLVDEPHVRPDPALVERAVAALTTPELSSVVDLVTWAEGDAILVANHRGRVRLTADGRHEVLTGADPVARTDPMGFLPYALEVADPSPANERNVYPDPYRRIRSLLDDPTRSPDLVVVHTPSHYFPGEGGHLGEHGSLDLLQSRAPLMLSGAGLTGSPRYVHDHARLVDVGPTLALAAGVPTGDLRDGDGAALDGVALTRYLATGSRPRWVVGLLWDGASCGDLLHLAESGELPAVARLVERGVALRGGAVAEFPSVTLTNHTSILTGVGPGRHGVLGNEFYDRETSETVVPNDASTGHRSAQWRRAGVRTGF